MMATNFRSESEQWLECAPRSILIGKEDPVLFYSPCYEQNLLDEYLPGASTRSEFLASCSDSGSSPSSLFSDFPLDSIDTDDLQSSPYEPETPPSMPSPKYEPELMDIRRPTRRVKQETVAAIAMVGKGEVKKRGRPAGSKSNSKMAVYAKNYREMKKEETRTLADRVLDLQQENAQLRSEAKEWKDKFTALSQQMKDMTKSSSRNQRLSSLISIMSERVNKNVRLCFDQNGEPYLEAAQ